MFTLENVSDAILELQKYAGQPDADMAAVHRRNRDLFYLMMQQGDFFAVAADPKCSDQKMKDKTFLPYIAGIRGNGDKQYLRLFSHMEAAKNYASQIEVPESCCVAVSAVETMQLAKYWMTRGVYGYILNDGCPWATISFIEYLCIVFQELLERPELYNAEYAVLAELVIDLQAGDSAWRSTTEENLVRISKGGDGEPLTYAGLTGISKGETIIEVKTEEKMIRTSAQSLRMVLTEFSHDVSCPSCHSAIKSCNAKCPFCGAYAEENLSREYDFKKLESVCLDFSVFEPVEESSSAEPQENNEKPAFKKAFGVFFKSRYQRFSNLVNNTVAKLTKKQDKEKMPEESKDAPSVVTENTDDVVETIDLPKEEPPTDDVPVNEPSMDENRVVSKRQKQRRERNPVTKKRLIQLGVITVILLSLGVMGKQALTLHGFEAVINHGEITAAKEVYDRKLNGRFMRGRADRIVVSYIDALLDSYAENKIDASYTGTKLRECSVFENEEEYLRKSLEKALQMEISKNAYVSGTSYFEQGNYLQGLSDWMNVISQDINNYNAVRAIVEKYGSEYKLHGLLQCAEYKSNGDTVRYQKGLDVLLQWFPNDRDILNEREKESGGTGSFVESAGSGSVSGTHSDTDDRNNPFSPYYVPSASTGSTSEDTVDKSVPIQISKLSVSLPNSNSGRNLRIEWRNVSGKTISSITFTVEALNGAGKSAKCSRGDYSIYRATATGPFVHGDGMDGAVVWESAWYNSAIENVRLIGIKIEYEGGKMEEITKTETLDEICR